MPVSEGDFEFNVASYGSSWNSQLPCEISLDSFGRLILDLRKNFWACERIWVPVLVWTNCSIFFQFFPWMRSPELVARNTFKEFEVFFFCPSAVGPGCGVGQILHF
jgi:hypothetical protein